MLRRWAMALPRALPMAMARVRDLLRSAFMALTWSLMRRRSLALARAMFCTTPVILWVARLARRALATTTPVSMTILFWKVDLARRSALRLAIAAALTEALFFLKLARFFLA